MKKYTRSTQVPSESNPNKLYTVSITEEGEYECSCPAWTRHVPRKDCKHITYLKNNGFQSIQEVDRFIIVPAMVAAVKRDNNNRDRIFVPLIPLNENHVDILATSIYDLMNLHVSWQSIKDYYHLQPGWTKQAVIGHVRQKGRAVYTKWIKGLGWTELKHEPVLE